MAALIPPAEIAAIRELNRYRRKLTEERTRETQRLHKVLEDGGIKLDSVASDSLGVSGRAMITALIAGERGPGGVGRSGTRVDAQEDSGSDAGPGGPLRSHHGLLAGLHLNHIDHLNATIARLDVSIDAAVSPFARQRDLLMTIPGVGHRAANTIIAEIGADMSRFPTADHLASWAGLCPGNNESAGKQKKTTTRNGNAQPCSVLVE